MKYKEIPIDIEGVLGRSEIGDRPRSPLPHVTQIIRGIEETITNPNRLPEYELIVRGSMGFVWERLIQEALVKAQHESSSCPVFRPGEMVRDGIAGNPDAIDLSSYAVEEWKCTWRSMNRIDSMERDFWPWLIQMKAYCHLADTDTSRLRIFFVNGNYHGSGPCVRCFEFEFSPVELKENWDLLTRYAQKHYGGKK